MSNNTQVQNHKRNAVWSLIHRRGTEQGVSPALCKHAYTWFVHGEQAQLPKKWQTQIQAVFERLVPPDVMQQLDAGIAQYIAGDDSELRHFVSERVVVEIGIIAKTPGYGHNEWRSRKFSDPLYLCPAGFLNAYPEADEDLFMDLGQADQAIAFYRGTSAGQELGQNASYRVIAPAVLGKIGGAGYQRWTTEVKGKTYIEPRRSLSETHEIYRMGGRDALKALYSPSYVFVLLRKFAKNGLPLHPVDQA